MFAASTEWNCINQRDVRILQMAFIFRYSGEFFVCCWNCGNQNASIVNENFNFRNVVNWISFALRLQNWSIPKITYSSEMCQMFNHHKNRLLQSLHCFSASSELCAVIFLSNGFMLSMPFMLHYWHPITFSSLNLLWLSLSLSFFSNSLIQLQTCVDDGKFMCPSNHSGFFFASISIDEWWLSWIV